MRGTWSVAVLALTCLSLASAQTNGDYQLGPNTLVIPTIVGHGVLRVCLYVRGMVWHACCTTCLHHLHSRLYKSAAPPTHQASREKAMLCRLRFSGSKTRIIARLLCLASMCAMRLNSSSSLLLRAFAVRWLRRAILDQLTNTQSKLMAQAEETTEPCANAGPLYTTSGK